MFPRCKSHLNLTFTNSRKTWLHVIFTHGIARSATHTPPHTHTHETHTHTRNTHTHTTHTHIYIYIYTHTRNTHKQTNKQTNKQTHTHTHTRSRARARVRDSALGPCPRSVPMATRTATLVALPTLLQQPAACHMHLPMRHMEGVRQVGQVLV